MDDVTSSLDAKNEFRLWRDLKKHQGVKSIILVTKHLETFRNTDLILVLEDDRVNNFDETDKLLQDISDLSTLLN
ncbi:MAG: hypothetical protein VX619_08005 [bacterium]|nr:hypothetical protein [bacterium]